MLNKYNDATAGEIDEAMQLAGKASQEYQKFSLKQRADFMKTIAKDLQNAGEHLISTAMEETHLSADRLQSEKSRTVFQLNSYAEACEKGEWMQIRIDTPDLNRTPAKPGIKKMMVPLGPVVVLAPAIFHLLIQQPVVIQPVPLPRGAL